MDEALFSLTRLGDLWAVNAGPEHLGVVVAFFDRQDDAESAVVDLNKTLRWHLSWARRRSPA